MILRVWGLPGILRVGVENSSVVIGRRCIQYHPHILIVIVVQDFGIIPLPIAMILSRNRLGKVVTVIDQVVGVDIEYRFLVAISFPGSSA